MFLLSLALFFTLIVAVTVTDVEAQAEGTTGSEFSFFGNTEANADESERTKEIQNTCVQPPAQTGNDNYKSQ